MTIVLHQFPTAADTGLLNVSPFCMKVEVYLQLSGLPYVKKEAATEQMRAPKKKLPFIDDDGAVIADSGFILEYLKRRYGDPLDADLDSAARVRAHLLRRTCEEAFYFPLLYSRWADPAGWREFRAAAFGTLPAALRSLIAPLARRKVLRQLYEQGTGRHRPDEVYALAAADLDAIAASLKEFAVDDRPRSVDATVFAFLANALWGPDRIPLVRHARGLAPIVSYVGRMRARLEKTGQSAA
jgi:glutathione S-transferase